MYKRILVPVDGSAASNGGLEQALNLSRTSHARLRILNVVDKTMLPASEPVPVDHNEEFVRFLKTSGRKALDAAAAAASNKHVTAECAQRTTTDRVSDVILSEAKKWKADMIVMGTHGRRGLSRLILGSDAERVLRDAPVPVMLVRTNGHARRSARRVG